jgi:hypothetical protein
MNQFDLNDIFKKNVGEFILTFSEIEFSIGILVSYLENGFDENPIIPEIIGCNLDDKKKRIRIGLLNNSELLSKWSIIEGRLSECNSFRKFIAHGIVCNHMPNPSLQGLVKAKPRSRVQGFHFKELTNEEIVKNLKKLVEINSGKNGVAVLTLEIKEWLAKKSRLPEVFPR